jgi:hypothetical protein
MDSFYLLKYIKFKFIIVLHLHINMHAYTQYRVAQIYFDIYNNIYQVLRSNLNPA